MKKILRLMMTVTAMVWVASLSTGCTAKMKKAYHESRADKFYAAGQLDRAEIEYLNVLRSDHTSAKAFARLGYIYFDQGRFQTAAPYSGPRSGTGAEFTVFNSSCNARNSDRHASHSSR